MLNTYTNTSSSSSIPQSHIYPSLLLQIPLIKRTDRLVNDRPRRWCPRVPPRVTCRSGPGRAHSQTTIHRAHPRYHAPNLLRCVITRGFGAHAAKPLLLSSPVFVFFVVVVYEVWTIEILLHITTNVQLHEQ